MKKLDDILYIIGSITICSGIFMLSVPIAIIVFGVFIMIASFGIYKAGK